MAVGPLATDEMRGTGIIVTALITLVFSADAPLRAEDFPSRLVKILVPFAAGGTLDMSARKIGEKLAARWGKPVIVENRPGAGTLIATACARPVTCRRLHDPDDGFRAGHERPVAREPRLRQRQRHRSRHNGRHLPARHCRQRHAWQHQPEGIRGALEDQTAELWLVRTRDAHRIWSWSCSRNRPERRSSTSPTTA